MSAPKRTLVIGIDGGTFSVLEKLIADGLMPNLAGLVETGASGILRSVLPPITGPAWRSFATGCNPGKHGLIDFVYLDQQTKRVQVSNTANSKLPTIWSEVSRHGRKVAVMGVPMTYPASAVNGVMITGLMAPPNAQRGYYPPALKEEIELAARSWPFSEGEDANAALPEPYLDKLIADMQARVDTALYLLRSRSPQLGIFIFGGSDPIQHQFWHAIQTEEHPLHEKVISYYQALDRHLGKLLEWAGEQGLVIVMSDHGFGELKGFLHLNNWLIENGYLVLKNDPLTSLRKLLHKAGYTPENLYRLSRRLGLDLRRRLNHGRIYAFSRQAFLSFANVDWDQTTVYSLGHIGQVYLQKENISESKFPKFKMELKQRLLDIRHPQTNQRLIEKVFDRDEIYHGPYINSLPDLVLQPKEFEYVAFGESELASNHLLGPALHQGHHRMEGMLIVKGPNVQRGLKLPPHHLEDLMPTILYSLDLPYPNYVDGEVVRDAFYNDYLSKFPPKIEQSDQSDMGDGNKIGYSDQEEKIIRERLKNLGYTA